MTNDEAKDCYIRAVDLYRAGNHAAALELLDHLDRARPNSRTVALQRGLCLAQLGRVAEADTIGQALDGKVEQPKLQELRALIADAKARAIASAVSHTIVAEEFDDGESVFAVEQAYPVSVEETTVTGHVRAGVFRSGGAVVVKSRQGQVLAPILRIGPADTPLNLIRDGQQGVLLLQVESQHIQPGTFLVASKVAQGQAAATLLEEGAAAGATMLPGGEAPELLEAERRVKGGDFGEVEKLLRPLLAREPQHPAANRMLARVYLEGGDALRNPAQALEHARAAYNNGGARDGATTDVLAEALAATGEAAQGLRYLERLHTATGDPAARGALAQRIAGFREKHGIGHVWEFADAYGDVVFQSGDADEIVKALERGIVGKDAKCRRDRIGEWRTIEEVLAPALPEVAALYKRKTRATSAETPWLAYIVVGTITAAAVGFAVVMIGS